MCTNCGSGTTLNFTLVFNPCKVCQLIDNDNKSKGVVFCDLCGAYICEPCYSNPVKRAAAAAMNFGAKVVEETKKVFSKSKKSADETKIETPAESTTGTEGSKTVAPSGEEENKAVQ